MQRLLLLFWLSFLSLLQAGRTQQRTTLFVEGLGTGVLNTIGIDRMIKIGPSYQVTLNGGGGFFSLGRRKMYSVPISGSLLLGKEAHFFELGVGMTYAQFRQSWQNPLLLLNDTGIYSTLENYQVDKSIEREQYLFATSRVGYRFQKQQGGWFFKIGFTPLMPVIWEDKSIYKGENPYPSITHSQGWGLRTNDKVVQLWGGVGVGYTLK